MAKKKKPSCPLFCFWNRDSFAVRQPETALRKVEALKFISQKNAIKADRPVLDFLSSNQS
jgi:hypothetical protein